ncbi:MAG TPA: response regulator transcription factor [Candidatus Acidoferrum sp.]
MTRVFIVAASPFARGGLENLLAARGITVIGSTSTLDLLAEQVLDAEPDAVLVDASGEHLGPALEAVIASELAAETAMIVLLDHAPLGWVADALRAGVRGILPAALAADQLAAAIEAAIAGLFIVHPAELSAMLPAAATTSSTVAELAEPLTPREREVLQMLASGLANKEIAAKLSISDHTAKFHVASILGKLGASTRTEAVALGIRRGLVLL